MAEITIEIPEWLRDRLKKEKVNLPVILARVIKQLEEEKEMTDWSVKLQHTARKGRLNELKRKGLI